MYQDRNGRYGSPTIRTPVRHFQGMSDPARAASDLLPGSCVKFWPVSVLEGWERKKIPSSDFMLAAWSINSVVVSLTRSHLLYSLASYCKPGVKISYLQ